MNTKMLAGAVSVAMLVAGVSAVQAANGAYVGANVGQSAIDECTGVLLAGCDDDDTGWKIFGGYDVNQNFAVEAGYADLGDSSFNLAGAAGAYEQDGMFIDAKGTLPIGETFAVFAKVGALFWDVEGTGIASGYSEDGTDLSYGLGAEVMFTPQVGGRVEWQQFKDVDGFDLTLWTGGAVLKF